MQQQRWIKPCGNESSRRKNYRLTKLGRDKVAEELARIQRLRLAADNAVKLMNGSRKK